MSTDMDTIDLSSTIFNFAFKFCNELTKKTSVVSSPLSAEYILALLALGTSEPSHKELISALGFANDEEIRKLFSTVSTVLKSTKGVTLNIANKVYIKEGDYDLKSEIKQDAVLVFDAQIEKMTFDDGAAAAQSINKWVENQTNNKIKNLLSSDCLNSDTRIVLVNAIYFKGTWKTPFNVNNTSEQPFYLTANSTVNIPMMYMESQFKYGANEVLNAQLLEIPYAGNEASMLIVLPNEIEGLNDLLNQLASGFDLVSEITQNMLSKKVQTSIPKFKIETEIDLKKLLPKLGINSIFDKAKSGITKLLNNDEPLYVSKAVQKAFIEINEEGAEAAAATGLIRMKYCMPRPPIAFRADHEFLYLLKDKNNSTFFIGVYSGA